MSEAQKGYSIELPLATQSRQQLIEKLCEYTEGPWAKMAEEHPELPTFKPHLSFAVIREPTDAVGLMRQIVIDFAHNQSPFTIHLSSIGVFPGKRPVLSLMPANQEQLLAGHHRITDRLSEVGIVPIPYYRKGGWSPHITLIMGRPRREVSAAIESLSRIWWAGNYTLDRIELVEFHPAVKLEQLDLVGGDS